MRGGGASTCQERRLAPRAICLDVCSGCNERAGCIRLRLNVSKASGAKESNEDNCHRVTSPSNASDLTKASGETADRSRTLNR